jgi:hypothetical protein
MVPPMRISMTWSQSTKPTPSLRANCRPTVDLPLPGMPTKANTIEIP